LDVHIIKMAEKGLPHRLFKVHHDEPKWAPYGKKTDAGILRARLAEYFHITMLKGYIGALPC
jgi:hypothetical protein